MVGLLLLIVGLVLFFGPHVFTSLREPRAALLARIGEGPYKGLYSVIAIAGVILAGYGFGLYRSTGWVDVWYPPDWTRHITLLLVWLGMIGVAAAYLRGRIYRALKHPMLTGTKSFAAGHLVANGDLGSIVLFGSLLAWAVYDRVTLKRRADPGAPPMPVGGWGFDVAAVVVGTLIFLALGFYFHPYVVGIPVFR